MATATGDDLVKRFDVRLIGDLATDSGSTLDVGDVATHPNVVAALEDAAGEMVVALQVGGRYTEADLLGLSGFSLAHAKRIQCDIAMALLMKRRPIVGEEESREIAKQSRDHLKRLSGGENVFGIPAVIESGNIELTAPSTVDITNLNLLTERMSRYFPDTGQRMPRGR
jgi:phage gp36-like protein